MHYFLIKGHLFFLSADFKELVLSSEGSERVATLACWWNSIKKNYIIIGGILLTSHSIILEIEHYPSFVRIPFRYLLVGLAPLSLLLLFFALRVLHHDDRISFHFVGD